MLERLFTSKTRVSIIKLLMFKRKEYHLRDIAKRVGAVPINVSRELDNLQKINLVRFRKVGNLSLYQINADCLIYESLRDIFIRTEYIGDFLREKLSSQKFAFIYGSFALGTEQEHSDIDLFVIGDIKGDAMHKISMDAGDITHREVNYILWDEKTFNERRDHYLFQSMEKIIMLVGDEDEFRGLVDANKKRKEPGNKSPGSRKKGHSHIQKNS